MPSLFERFRQRKLVQWTLAYSATAAALISLQSAFAQSWDIPAGAQRAVQVVVLLGIPVTAVLAWYHGEQGRQRVTPSEWMLLLGILGIGGVFIAATAPRSRVPSMRAAAADARPFVQLAVLPPKLGGSFADSAGMSLLLQGLIADELMGRRGIALKDPLSTNASLGPGASDQELAQQGLDYALRVAVVAERGGLNVVYNLTDVRTSALVSTHRFRAAGEADLPAHARAAAQRIVARILEERNLPLTLDLEPWLERDPRKVEATRAFLQGAEYSYRNLEGGGRWFERALEIDPGFIAPRVWLVSGAAEEGDTAAMRAHLRVLRALAFRASPFEQAMIDWAEAVAAGDREARVRHLQVALSYSPNNNILLYDLALNLLALGRVQEAWAAASIAVNSHWHFAPFYSLWGVVSIESGNIDGLQASLESAVQLPSPSPYVYGLLEALSVMNGDTVAARRWGRPLREAVNTGRTPDALREFVPYYRKLAQLAHERGDEAARKRLLQWTESVQ